MINSMNRHHRNTPADRRATKLKVKDHHMVVTMVITRNK